MKETFSLEKQRTNDLIKGLKKIVEDWHQIYENKKTKEGLDEDEVRNTEKSIVQDLIKHLENNPQEGKNPKLKFVVGEYLRIGDCTDLAKKLAPLVELKYNDLLGEPDPSEEAVCPDLSAKSVLKEMGEYIDDDDKSKMN